MKLGTYKPIAKLCVVCGQPLILRNARDVVRKRFCSRTCAGKVMAVAQWTSQRADMLKIIRQAAQRPASRRAKARSGQANPRWQGGPVVQVCVWCRQPFTVARHRVCAGNGKYCSRDCYLAHHAAGGHKKERWPAICEVCQTVTYHQPFWAVRRRTCSRRCSAILAARTVSMRTSGTWIEDAIEALLIALGVPYEKQKALLGLTLCDFFVGPNLVIYADGTYWHSQRKRRVQDAFVTRQLLKAGYRVLRFSEARIASAFDLVEIKLKEELHAGSQSKAATVIRGGARGPKRPTHQE